MKNKKAGGAIAALVGALMYGATELVDMQERLKALEDIHPELVTEEPMSEDVEQDLESKSSQQPEDRASEEVSQE